MKEATVALDSSALPPADTAPEGDSPPTDDGSQAGNTPPPQPVDWQARYKATQAELTRKAQKAAQLERELADARAVAEPEADDEDEDQPASRPRGRSSAEAEALRSQLAAMEQRDAEMQRQVAESVHGNEVVAGYDQWVEMWNGTETESDRITALLAFADLVRGSTTAPAPTQTAPSRADATAPRVDQNRSDATPQDPIDPKRYEGGQNGGVAAWVKANFGSDARR